MRVAPDDEAAEMPKWFGVIAGGGAEPGAVALHRAMHRAMWRCTDR